MIIEKSTYVFFWDLFLLWRSFCNIVLCKSYYIVDYYYTLVFHALELPGTRQTENKKILHTTKKLTWQISYTYGFVPNFNIFPPKFYKFNNHSQQKSWAFWTYTINIISVQKKIPIMQMRIFNTPNIVYILIKFILAKLLLLFVLWAFWLLLYAVWNLQNGVSLSLLKISSTEAQYFLKVVFL